MSTNNFVELQTMSKEVEEEELIPLFYNPDYVLVDESIKCSSSSCLSCSSIKFLPSLIQLDHIDTKIYKNNFTKDDDIWELNFVPSQDLPFFMSLSLNELIGLGGFVVAMDSTNKANACSTCV
ncbi:hypothetical protein VNO80_19536 [Phaseolus coccineus]|uniref:Uncharacterized protein n=1 Tax=Phaseolus coccineus TaxID=3886 RepID=A0AAN9R0R5_PHACN